MKWNKKKLKKNILIHFFNLKKNEFYLFYFFLINFNLLKFVEIFFY